jgi:hypothetical protein
MQRRNKSNSLDMLGNGLFNSVFHGLYPRFSKSITGAIPNISGV